MAGSAASGKGATAGGSLTTELDSRYGRTPGAEKKRRLVVIVAAAGFAVVFGAWLLWAGLLGQAASLEWRTLGYELVDDSLVQVRFELTVEPGEETACAVEALNAAFGVVGWKVVDIPPSEQRTRAFTEEVRTTELAVSGLIYRCWLV